MTWLVSGCSFTYGDELKTPEQERWSTHLGKLTNENVINVANSGNCNKAIWRSVKEVLLRNNDITKVIIIWSAFERIEVIDLNPHLQFDLEDGKTSRRDLAEYRYPTPYIQYSPSRLDAHPFRLKSEEMEVYYNKIYTNEQGILDSMFYMRDVYNTCSMLGITAYGGIFHQNINYTIAKAFSDSRLNHLGARITRIHALYKDYLKGFNDGQKIGFTGSAFLTFNEFTEVHKYNKMPDGHPGPEAHKAYAEYLFKEVIDNGQ